MSEQADKTTKSPLRSPHTKPVIARSKKIHWGSEHDSANVKEIMLMNLHASKLDKFYENALHTAMHVC